MKIKLFFVLLVSMILSISSGAFAATGTTVTLTFEGLTQNEAVSDYYNGGYGHDYFTGLPTSGPGPYYGVVFSSVWAAIDADAGGDGNFGGEPSPDTAIWFQQGNGGGVMNVPGGFSGRLSLYYSNPNGSSNIYIYDGLNKTGNLIATFNLPRTPSDGAPDPTGSLSPLVYAAVNFEGIAKSASFIELAHSAYVDNISLELCPLPVDTTPDPFTFIDQTDVELNTTMTSNTITITGINTAAPISITGGTYSVNGGAYTSASGTANNGDTVNVRLTSAGSNSTMTVAKLTIGGVFDTFSLTTVSGPDEPEPGSITLTFEGLTQNESVGDYYNGGYGYDYFTGLSTSGPGPSFGVIFSNVWAAIDADAGGDGNFGGEPSPDTAIWFQQGSGGGVMNVPGGFHGKFSFYYSNPNGASTIYIYDDLNKTGNLIATLNLPRTPSNGAPDPTGGLSPLVYAAVNFEGIAKSVSFLELAHSAYVDNISFAPISGYVITASAGANGNISPSALVNPGANTTFSITPNAYYHIADVLVDGVSVGAVASYTFTNVTDDHTIYATFTTTFDSHTITATAGVNGTISPPSAVATPGSNATFTITPDADYHIADVSVDGNSVGALSSYTFSDVTADHTISATFALNTGYVLTFEGLTDYEGVGNYYNGGYGFYFDTEDPKSGPGPDYGVTFSNNVWAKIDSNAVSGDMSMRTQQGGGVMNVPDGFGGLSLYYSNTLMDFSEIYIYDGLDKTGSLIATFNLPRTPDGGSFVYAHISFAGEGKSVDFSGTLASFDNITFSPVNTKTLRLLSASNSNDGASGSSGGGSCFIATAAFGSPMECHVQILRDFRDRYLLSSRLGQIFVNFYYRVSPPIAAIIAQNEVLRLMTRWCLMPLIGIAYLIFTFGIINCVLMTTIGVLLLLLFVWRRQRGFKHDLPCSSAG